MKDPDLFRAVRAIRMEYHLVGGIQTVRHVHDLAVRLGYEINKLEKMGHITVSCCLIVGPDLSLVY